MITRKFFSFFRSFNFLGFFRFFNPFEWPRFFRLYPSYARRSELSLTKKTEKTEKTEKTKEQQDSKELKEQSEQGEQKEEKGENKESQNPYVMGFLGRAEWNDRYMNLAKSVKNWQLVSLCLMVLTFLQMIVIVKIATESRIEPYIVETHHGVPYAVNPVGSIQRLSTQSEKDQMLLNYAINRFVINAKSVLADPVTEEALLKELYAYSAGDTQVFLKDYYQEHNPFDLGEDHTTDISIIHSFPISEHTWEVIWEEIQRPIHGRSATKRTQWIGHFTYQTGEVNPKYQQVNPFGIYITRISWSKGQAGSLLREREDDKRDKG